MQRFIYLIRARTPAGEFVGPIKIGITNNVTARLHQLQSAHTIQHDPSLRLEVLTFIEGNHADERRLHKRFASARLDPQDSPDGNSEWFIATEAILAEVRVLRYLRGGPAYQRQMITLLMERMDPARLE